MLVIHADWSVSPGKRWAALATRTSTGWEIVEVRPVLALTAYTTELLRRAAREPVVAGFDFPVGVPAAYGAKTGLQDFWALLKAIGSGPWAHFHEIAREPNEISIQRPFYPATSEAGLKQVTLLQAHGVGDLDELRRTCERARPDRRAACSLFWTLGGNQVGRAALAGWLEVLRPALAAGAKLWPFDGVMSQLTAAPGLTLAETYPAEAYGHVGVRFAPAESKRRQSDRLSKAGMMEAWAEQHQIRLTSSVAALVRTGFGEDAAGEDRFDALLGLMGMIEVIDGRREDGPRGDPQVQTWEGWILGQTPVDAGARALTDYATEAEGQDSVDQALVQAVRDANPATRAAILRHLSEPKS